MAFGADIGWPVLSLRQPWAHVVVYMGKDIENRRWNTSLRGDFLIHASKGMTKDEYYSCWEFCRRIDTSFHNFPPLKSLLRGGIIGAARLVGVLPPCPACVCDPERGIVNRPCGADHRWHMPWQYGFQLQNVRPSPEFIPCTGHLGFFNATSDVVTRLRSAAQRNAG